MYLSDICPPLYVANPVWNKKCAIPCSNLQKPNSCWLDLLICFGCNCSSSLVECHILTKQRILNFFKCLRKKKLSKFVLLNFSGKQSNLALTPMFAVLVQNSSFDSACNTLLSMENHLDSKIPGKFMTMFKCYFL